MRKVLHKLNIIKHKFDIFKKTLSTAKTDSWADIFWSQKGLIKTGMVLFIPGLKPKTCRNLADGGLSVGTLPFCIEFLGGADCDWVTTIAWALKKCLLLLQVWYWTLL